MTARPLSPQEGASLTLAPISFMIFMKELTNQILLPGFRAVLTVHSQVNGGVYMLTAFASFLADSEGEEQDDGFLG